MDKVEKILDDVNGTQTEASMINPEVDQAKTYFGGRMQALRFFIHENRPRLLSRRTIRKATDRVSSESKVNFEKRLQFMEDEAERKTDSPDQLSYDEDDEVMIEEAFYNSKETFLAKAVKESMENIGLSNMKQGKEREKIESALGRSFGGMTGLGLGFGAIEFGHEQIIAIQKACRLRNKMDAHFGAIVDNFKSYIIGRGVKFKFNVPEIQEVVQEKYWDFNDMESEQNVYLIDLLVNGERFSRYKKAELTEGEKNFVVLSIDSVEISDIDVVEKKFPAYYLRKGLTALGKEIEFWYKSSFFDKIEERGLEVGEVRDTDDSKEEEVYHMKFGGDVRGFPPFARILRVLRFLETFIKDVSRLYHEQARVILVKYIPKNYRGFDKPLSKTVKGGIVLKGIKDVVDYEFKSPKISAGPVETIGRLYRITISSGSRMPEFIAFMDAKSGVFASVKKMETPFSNAVLDYQDAFKCFLETEVRIFLKWAIEEEFLKDEYEVEVFEEEAIEQAFEILIDAINSGAKIKESSQAVVDVLEEKTKKIKVKTLEAPIDWIFPDMVSDEPLALAERMKIQLESGIISKQTASTQSGLNWKLEVSRMAREALMASNAEKEKDDEEANLLSQGRENEIPDFGISELDI